MSARTLYRLSGLAAIVSGLSTLVFVPGVYTRIIPESADPPRGLITLTLTIFALMGIYGRQHEKAGGLGLVGFMLGVIGLILNICIRFLFTFVAPVLAGYSEAANAVGASGPYNNIIMFTFLVFMVGYVSLGIATFRAGILPRWAAVLFGLGALISFFLVALPINIGAILTAIGLIWMGFALWTENVQAAATQRASAVAD